MPGYPPAGKIEPANSPHLFQDELAAASQIELATSLLPPPGEFGGGGISREQKYRQRNSLASSRPANGPLDAAARRSSRLAISTLARLRCCCEVWVDGEGSFGCGGCTFLGVVPRRNGQGCGLHIGLARVPDTARRVAAHEDDDNRGWTRK